MIAFYVLQGSFFGCGEKGVGESPNDLFGCGDGDFVSPNDPSDIEDAEAAVTPNAPVILAGDRLP